MIWKKIKKTFKDYCSYHEQIIEFEIRYHDLYDFHCRYYEEVQFECFLFIYYISIFIFLKHHTTGFAERKIFQKVMDRLYENGDIHPNFGRDLD